ncbi:MAG: hypothetical protein J6336_01560, partial [Kiritimatiellae bacterium]|nr:hypothetical protein [Kiritimatiellia bacterium]
MRNIPFVKTVPGVSKRTETVCQSRLTDSNSPARMNVTTQCGILIESSPVSWDRHRRPNPFEHTNIIDGVRLPLHGHDRITLPVIPIDVERLADRNFGNPNILTRFHQLIGSLIFKN